MVTISYDHPHHAGVEGVEGSPRVIRGPGEYETHGAMIWGIRTRRREVAEGVVPWNTVYLVQLEDLTICHLGDLGSPLTTEQLTSLKDAQVLLVPVGGHCTINGTEAAQVVAQIEPRVIIPMHYATAEPQGAVELDDLSRFAKEMGITEVAPQSRLNVTAGSIPLEPTVVVLEQRR